LQIAAQQKKAHENWVRITNALCARCGTGMVICRCL